MTDRLADLLAREAEGLDVPSPHASAVLAEGRRLRRRRTARVTAAGVAAAVVVAGGLGLAASLGGDGRTETAGDPGTDLGPVFSIGATVYFDGGAETATIDDAAVKSMYYTSAGVVVRHGDNPYSDGGGPQRFSLLTADGDVRPLTPETEGRQHASDPDQPYLVWAEPTGDGAEVVVWDVESDTETARVSVPDVGSDFLPVSLDGDRVYLGTGDSVRVVDWRTGKVTTSDVLDSSEVAGGHAVDGYGDDIRVVDADTGDVVLETSVQGYGFFDLSPDGRFARVSIEDERGTGDGAEPSFDVYDLDTGEHVTLPGGTYDYGWTVSGDQFRVDGDEVTTCSSTTGACDTEAVDVAVEEGSAATGEEVCEKYRNKAGEVLGEMCSPDTGEDDFSDDLVLGGLQYES